MEIQLYNPNSIVPFTTNDLSIVKAIESRLVNSVSDDELKGKLLELVHNAHLTAGIKPPEDKRELNITLNEIIAEQRRNRSNLRFKELEIAFKNGVHKKYGEYYGLNAVSFCMFIREYLKEEARIEALRLKNTSAEPKLEPTLEQRFETAKSNALTSFENYKLGKDISIVAPTVYKFLRRLNLFEYSDEEQQEFITEAREEMLQMLKAEKANCIDRSKRNELKSIIENFNPEKNLSLNDKIINHAKRLGLYAFFQELILNEEDLNQLIETNKPEL